VSIDSIASRNKHLLIAVNNVLIKIVFAVVCEYIYIYIYIYTYIRVGGAGTRLHIFYLSDS